jgi:hypothetical protein
MYSTAPHVGYLGSVLTRGATLFYGPGLVPGTDIPTYRFVLSRGFRDRDEYKEAQRVARTYSRGLGFDGLQGHFESFAGP